jgi:hypothetical protein
VNIRREPAALLIGLLVPLVSCLSAFLFAADAGTQTVVNAAAVAVAGAITAFLVRSDNLLPAITGAVTAIVSVAVALGLRLDSTQQVALIAALGAISAVVVRDRVTAPASVEPLAG